MTSNPRNFFWTKRLQPGIMECIWWNLKFEVPSFACFSLKWIATKGGMIGSIYRATCANERLKHLVQIWRPRATKSTNVDFPTCLCYNCAASGFYWFVRGAIRVCMWPPAPWGTPRTRQKEIKKRHSDCTFSCERLWIWTFVSLFKKISSGSLRRFALNASSVAE